jgi:hypothetical protein
MAARVAAIHVFGAAGHDVDGRTEPGHDGGTSPVGVTELNRTAVDRAQP